MKTLLHILIYISIIVSIFSLSVLLIGIESGMTFSQWAILVFFGIGGIKVGEKCAEKLERIRKEDYYE